MLATVIFGSFLIALLAGLSRMNYAAWHVDWCLGLVASLATAAVAGVVLDVLEGF